MMTFILKGLLRDRHRSLLPIIVIALGVLLTTLMYGWVRGVIGDMISTSAKLETGHVKIMTQDYADIANQIPNDFGIQGLSALTQQLSTEFNVEWVPRIRFGGLLDIPDDEGETRSQGPVFGMGIDLLSENSPEVSRFDLANVINQGRLPNAPGELIVASELMSNLGIQLGDTATFIGGTANGSMAIHNFIVVGSFHYGIQMLDRNMILADLGDVQYALDMENATGELLGYLPNNHYDAELAQRIKTQFQQQTRSDGFGSPLVMRLLTEQSSTGDYFALVDLYIGMIMGAMILFMSIVLWNFGLMSGLRRYGEIGVRLAMGESKTDIVRWLIYESIVIGIIGSAIGTAIGMSLCYWLQEVGFDISSMMQGSTIMMSNVMRAEVRPEGFIIGFIPGIASVVLGTALSAIGVYRRSTASLFKELEV
ncbi:MAG: FtsX-like permease family protein [Reinekea sp.]|nr:FtsX-like permease family protein [Reinekea sp.]